MGYIYILTSPNGKSYIGQTTRPIEKRLEEHQKESSECVAICNAIQYHGWENIEKDWYECPDKDLNFDEELLVREMGTLSPGGYNLREGGGANGKLSEDTKQKMRKPKSEDTKKKMKKPKSEDTKQKMKKPKSEDAKQKMRKPKSEEHRQKLSEATLGKPKSEEHRQKISTAQLGKTHSDETKQKMSESRRGDKHRLSKKVYQYDLEGKLLGSFGSGGEAARHLKEKYGSTINACARGKIKKAYGFKWSYFTIEF